MDFPTLKDGMFPHIDNVDVYQYKNEFDYSRFDTDQAHITVCHVPWDVGLVHVGDKFIEGLGNVVKFADETARSAYISGLSDKFEFDTKYRRYHLELEIKLPIPVDRCAEYNYIMVHHEPMPDASDPVQYESAVDGVKDWFFFIRELKYLAPNTTYAVLMLDVWQTFIYRFGISGVMLERGHYPLSQSDADAFLSDPIGNSAYLLDPDINASDTSVSAWDDVHIFDDNVLFALFTTFDFAGSYGVKHQSGWKSPSIGIVGKSGYPSQTCIAVETSDAQSLLDYLRTYIPQSLECIQACAFLPRELVEASVSFALGTLTVYNLASKKNSIVHELDRADFAYPEQYAELAKLYTAPYASIVITDGADTVTIAPQTVSGNTIEIITDLQLIADALRMRSQTVHVGGSNIYLGFERLTSKTFTVSGNMQDLSLLRDIPTYSIYIDNSVIYDNDNHWLNEQRKAEAAARLADATDRATATKANAYTSAQASKDNAYASALVSKTDAYTSAQASKDNAYASALASKDNAYASALASKDNTYASAQTANANAYEQAQAQNIIDIAVADTAKADAVANAYAAINDAKDNADTAKADADASALADKQNADASAWAEQTNSNASALADKQNADSSAWAEQTNSNASALADYTNRNSSAFAVKTDADEEGNTKTANAALNVAANSLINSYATTDATSQANYNISYNGVALAADNAYTTDTANAQSDAQIQSAAVSVAGNAIGAAATGAMAGSVIPGVGTVAGAVAGIISAVPNAAEVAANTAIGVNLSLTQAQLAIANASSKESYANTTMSSKTATSNYYSTASTNAGNNLITDTTANEAALIQTNAARDYACDIDNSQRTYDTEVNNATNIYSAETSNAQNTYDTLINNATNTYSAETSNALNTYNIRTANNTRDKDTAHAIADRDYAVAIGIANRDNATTTDNADLAKLTAESIADRSQATDKTNADRSYNTTTDNADRDYNTAVANADRSYNASTANADRDYNTAVANADRSYNASTANADRDYNTALAIAQRDNAVQLAAIDADIAQAALKAPYAVCAGSVQDAGAETPNYIDIQVRTMQTSDIRRIGDEFLRYGYAYHGYVSDPDFTVMPRFTYWQCSEIFISDLSIPDAYADQIRYLLIGGVTVWSDPAYIGNTSIYDNVIGV